MRVVIAGVLAACSAWAAGSATLVFTKSFPGSVPAYEFFSVDRTGALQYKESPTDNQPVTAQLPQADVTVLFDEAQKLGYFQSPLESGLKVANTGKKTFRYIDENGMATETTFNYSTDPTAKLLLDKFEQITASERAYLDLDRTIHFDKLGVNDALAEIESLWLQHTLAAPQQFIPFFNRIIGHESFMHLVRDRAARLKSEFEASSGVASTTETR
jgi:hypothetical protein